MKTGQLSIIFALLSSLNSCVTAFTCSGIINTGRRTILFSTTEEATNSPTPNETTSNQAKYGSELSLPDTYVRCGRCATSFAIKEDDLGDGKGR